MKLMSNALSIVVQAEYLSRMFPDCELRLTRKQLVWRCNLRPTTWSQTYTVKIKYTLNKSGKSVPFIYVDFPRHLPLAEGETKLPHVYNHESQQICLYDWRDKEWNPSMPIAYTIVPWASEWLYDYEVWVMTGVWYGGGHYVSGEENKIKLNNEI